MIKNIKNIIKNLHGKFGGFSFPRGKKFDLYRCFGKSFRKGIPLNFIDIGSNRGQFCSDINRLFDLNRCWLIEPQSNLCQELVLQFSPPIFSIHSLAIGEFRGSVTLEICSELDVTASTLKIISESPELRHLNLGKKTYVEVPVVTLDDFSKEMNISHIDLIKVDTQGSELGVLSAGLETLKKTQAVWIEMSLVPLYEGSCLIHEVVQFLHKQGLFLREINPEFRGPSGELLQVNGFFSRDAS